MQKTLHKMWNYKWVYLMLLPVIIYFIVFKYVPMYGIVLAFKDYNVFKGIMESPWVGFKIFQKIFHLPETGVVDFATWYKISQIYVAVSRIAELK